jgi:UDP-GlcNAc3NAcA epimerase
MKLFSIVGARPQFIKIAPVCRAIADRNKQGAGLEDVIIHTGQHYDASMSDVFFEELNIPKADFHLGVGSASHGAQTGQMLQKLEELMLSQSPDMVVIYGDTNSTVAGALAAAKLHIPIAHVEAGLRSFNRKMPEEVNRIVADHISDILLAPTPTAIANLDKENLADRTLYSGDIMHDAVIYNRKLADEKSSILSDFSLKQKSYAVVTVHRAENTDDPTRLREILDSLNEVAANGLKLVFPVHPRTKKTINNQFPDWKPSTELQLIEPVGYLDMLQLVVNARMAITDSGGLQKETFFLNCPCITIRDETEWVETVDGGGNIVTGVNKNKIIDAVNYWNQKTEQSLVDFSDQARKAFGEGNSADKIVQAILDF